MPGKTCRRHPFLDFGIAPILPYTARTKQGTGMTRHRSISLLAAATLIAGTTGEALAHPHVWVTMQTSVVFNEQGLVSGVAVEWTFDDAYAQTALEGMDSNGDGVYSPDELDVLTRENIDALKDYDYFTFMTVDGKPQARGPIKDAGQVYSNDKLTLHFTVSLPQPVDPRQHKFEVKIFDPEFYISFEYYADEPTDYAGELPKGCAVDIKPIPTTAELESTRTMLATKGTDWKPEDPSQQFGSMFAQPVSVACQPA